MKSRITRRYIMRLPLHFRLLGSEPVQEQTGETVNICSEGIYFATDQPIPPGSFVQVRLEMPQNIVGEEPQGEWCFTGRVVHVQAGRMSRQRSGVGVHFLYYEVSHPKAKPRAVFFERRKRA